MAKRALIRGFQWDLGRQIERPDALLKLLPKYADWGYQQCYLYLEGAFDFPSVPGIGKPHAYTPADLEAIVGAAARVGMQVVPIVPLMGHTSYILKVPELAHLAGVGDDGQPDKTGQICPLADGTWEIVCKLLADIQPYCSAGLVHVGLDESFAIGTSPRSRREVEEVGLATHFARWIGRLHGRCRELGLRMGMWADMLYYLPEAIPQIPKDVLNYDWFYYPFKRLPRVELYNFADIDLTGELRKAGIEVFGCPCSGTFIHEPLPPFLDRLANIQSWWDYLRRRDGQGMLVTSWSPCRASIEVNAVVDAAAACLWLDPEIVDPRERLERGLVRVFGRSAGACAEVVAEIERYQFAGYYRWQINRTWQTFADTGDTAQYDREVEHFDHLLERAEACGMPQPLRDSLLLRSYMAHRDLFVRAAAEWTLQAREDVGPANMWAAEWQARAQEVIQMLPDDAGDDAEGEGRELAKAVEEVPFAVIPDYAESMAGLLREARTATRRMWRRTRYADEPNPVEAMLAADRARLTELVRFVRQAIRHPRKLHEPSPVLGRWQLLVTALTTAPALQSVVVERQRPDGTWESIYNLYTLEFTADAGRARTKFRRVHSVPVDWHGKEPLVLRIGARGFGQYRASHLTLHNGLVEIEGDIVASGGHVEDPEAILATKGGALLGQPAPTAGFPPIDWSATQGWVELRFEPFDLKQLVEAAMSENFARRFADVLGAIGGGAMPTGADDEEGDDGDIFDLGDDTVADDE